MDPRRIIEGKNTASFLDKYAPRWIAAHPWKAAALKQGKEYRIVAYFVFGALICHYFTDPQLMRLHWFKKRDEDPAPIKELFVSPWARDWKEGEYWGDVPPIYDLRKRRLQYPEYYPVSKP